MVDHAERLRRWATMKDEDGMIVGRTAAGHLREAADEIDNLCARIAAARTHIETASGYARSSSG